MKIQKWNIKRLVPYARNARKIPQSAVDKVAASLKEFGWQQPIVVDAAGVIIAGHTRYQAALKLEMKEVPVHVATGLNPAQVKAYRLMDNRSHQEASWDVALIAPELEELAAMGYEELTLTGFDLAEVEKFMLGTDGLAKQEEAPDQSAQLKEQFQVIVTCDSETAQANLLDRLAAEGFECRALVS
jgi:ParB-like chromosome segregation protein Spo0J